jgi:hypothetical protein
LQAFRSTISSAPSTCLYVQLTNLSSRLDNGVHGRNQRKVQVSEAIRNRDSSFTVAVSIFVSIAGLNAQQLEPRAYSISPIGVNVINMS